MGGGKTKPPFAERGDCAVVGRPVKRQRPTRRQRIPLRRRHREDRDDRVLLFADVLPAGVHHYESSDYLGDAVNVVRTPGAQLPLRLPGKTPFRID